jgi:hypothetical protein
MAPPPALPRRVWAAPRSYCATPCTTSTRCRRGVSRARGGPRSRRRAGDRVVILGDETCRTRQTGATHRAEWAWVHDLHDGLITRLVVIQDLTRVADAVRAVISKAQSGNERAA